MHIPIWKDKSGKWIEAKEFKERFAKGVEGVTPLQQINSQITFTWITCIGITCGIFVSAVAWKTLWWLLIILLAALGNTITGIIGLYQKRIIFQRLEGGADNV